MVAVLTQRGLNARLLAEGLPTLDDLDTSHNAPSGLDLQVGLRGQKRILRLAQRDRQLRKDRDVGVKAYALDPHSERCEAPFVLEASKRTLDRRIPTPAYGKQH